MIIGYSIKLRTEKLKKWDGAPYHSPVHEIMLGISYVFFVLILNKFYQRECGERDKIGLRD